MATFVRKLFTKQTDAMKRLFSNGLFILLFQATGSAQHYCNFNDCLFWNEQTGQAIDSATVNYAVNQWSIDEWDNGVGCIVPIVNVQQCENLALEVFFPVLQAGEKRPLVVLIHGGAFIGGNRSQFRNQARELARLGYVAATISYRLCKRNNCLTLGWLSSNESWLTPAALCGLNFWTDFGTGAYVATVDANNAIRFLQNNAAAYGIDPDNVIVGGFSAGAWTAMHAAFLDQDEADGMGLWKNTWGPLNPVSGIKGVLCLGGAMYDTTFIDPDENHIPVFTVHGTCDPTVCYRHDAAFHCNAAYPKIHGGGDISTRLHHNGNPYYLFTGQNLGHDIMPASAVWNLEMLRFMRETMLCGQYIQKHSVLSLPAGNNECAVLQGPLLQYSHAPHPPVNLPSSQFWGGFPAPCIPVPADEPGPDAGIRIFPSLTRGAPVRIETATSATIQVFDLQGKLLFQHTLDAGGQLDIPAETFSPGLNMLKAEPRESGRVLVYKIIRM